MTEARGRAGPGRRPASPQGPAMHTARGGGDCPPGPCLLSRQCPNDTLAALWVFQPWASLGITVTGVRPPSLALAQMPPSHNSSLLLPLKCRLAHAVGPPTHTVGPPAHTVGPPAHAVGPPAQMSRSDPRPLPTGRRHRGWRGVKGEGGELRKGTEAASRPRFFVLFF